MPRSTIAGAALPVGLLEVVRCQKARRPTRAADRAPTRAPPAAGSTPCGLVEEDSWSWTSPHAVAPHRRPRPTGRSAARLELEGSSGSSARARLSGRRASPGDPWAAGVAAGRVLRQARLLEREADRAPHGRGSRARVWRPSPSRRERQRRAEHAHGRRFARAVGPEHPNTSPQDLGARRPEPPDATRKVARKSWHSSIGTRGGVTSDDHGKVRRMRRGIDLGGTVNASTALEGARSHPRTPQHSGAGALTPGRQSGPPLALGGA